MKKWLIALCCVLVAGVVAFVTLLNNSNARIDTLNSDLGGLQAEYNSLKEKSEKDEKTIEELNRQVGDLTAENGQLTAENGKLNETLESLNRNLSSSEEKLQGVMYILTEGAQGNIDSLLSPYVKIYKDVPLDSPYFEAADYTGEHQLMAPLGEDVFGVSDKATLGELAEGLYRLQGKSGTRAEAVTALLASEQAWLEANAPVEEAPEAEPAAEAENEEAAAEPETEEPEAEAASGPEAEETEAEAAEETAAEEAGEPDSGEEAAEAAAEPEDEDGAEEAAAAESAEAEEKAEAEAEEAAEEPEEEPAEASAPAEDETTVLTKARILTLSAVYCAENGKTLPGIEFPASGGEEASRGDLAIALMKLAQAE